MHTNTTGGSHDRPQPWKNASMGGSVVEYTLDEVKAELLRLHGLGVSAVADKKAPNVYNLRIIEIGKS